MKYVFLILVISFTFTSCRSKMDACIQRGIDQGMTKSQAKEACEEGRDDSYRR